MPIDGKYTLQYMFGFNRYETDDDEFDTFEFIFPESFQITKKLNLTQEDLNNQDRDTSAPKLIDDAIISYFKKYGM
jgi:hypothetical protein